MGTRNNESSSKSFEELTSQFLRAGYSQTSPSRDTKSYCDALGFGAKSDGTYGVVAVIEFKKNCDEKTMPIAAAGLLLAKEIHAAEYAFLKCGDDLFQLVVETRTFERTLEVPTISRTASLVVDPKIARHLLWQEMDRRRSNQDPNAALLSLIDEIDVIQGEVLWPKPALRIRGSVFAEVYLKAIESLGSKNSLSQSIGSSAITAVFKALAIYFPDSQKIFDPACGLGSTLAGVAEHIKVTAGATPTVAGFDRNLQAANLAVKLMRMFDFVTLTEVSNQDMTKAQWPNSDLLVCEPPMGLRLQDRVALGSGSIVQLEDYAIYRAAVQLRKGELRHGAILVTGRSWLWRNNTQPLRDYLAENNLVRALIGIPDISNSTSMPLLAVVLGHGSGDVAVAELGDDWLAQLNEQGGELSLAIRKSFDC